MATAKKAAATPAPRKKAAVVDGLTPRAAQPVEVIPFSWASNPHKLRSATDFVQENQPALKGKEKEAAIRERYVLLKGRIVGEDTPASRGKKGKVVNMADDDGGDDIENDEPEGDE